MTFKVEFSLAAQADLERLFDFVLQRELNSASGDLDLPERALKAINEIVDSRTVIIGAVRHQREDDYHK